MKRIATMPRGSYKEKLAELGFNFSDEYWLENAYYQFTEKEIDTLYEATKECYQMYIEAVQNVIDNNRWSELHIPQYMVDTLIDSWDSDELSLYGRFDFAFVDGMPKLLEFNADTPTSLFEAAIVQWNWKEEKFPAHDQFNSIHESLISSFESIHQKYEADKYHFACLTDNVEDYTTTAYILSTASDAGLSTSIMDMSAISARKGRFFNTGGEHLDVLFKLYPYEWMFNEEFGKDIPKCETTFIEPLWKAIMSNKQMLVILAELFPNSSLILDTRNKPLIDGCYCKKPVFSREGANVSIYKDGMLECETDGDYGEEGYVYQSLVEIKPFDGKYPVIGSWVIGGESCGIGIRETDSKITNNMANFVPHIIA